MSRRLVLLRHGETDWNAARRIQGQLNSELNETGLAQASAVAPALASLNPRVLWTSDLHRALRTAEIVGEACGLTPIADERLREYALGSLEGLTHDEYFAQDPDGFAVFRAAEWGAISEIESPDDVAKRFVACLTDLVTELGPNDLGVAVAHGAAIRTGLVAWLGWPVATSRDFRALGNCAWVELEERQNGEWALGAYNLSSS
ncbi:MAG: histidine phosphatase family protein [Marmoricola sp.]